MKSRRQNLVLIVATIALIVAVVGSPKLAARLRRWPAYMQVSLSRPGPFGETSRPLPKIGSFKNLKRLMGRAQESGELGGLDLGRRFGGVSGLRLPGANAEFSQAAAPEFSKTNVQVQGVDEADIVKTDGAYIYQINNQTVTITKARPPSAMKVAATVKVGGGSFYPSELYVDENYLVVIGGSAHTRPGPLLDPAAGSPERPVPPGIKTLPAVPVGTTKVFVFDISDKSAPRQIRDAEVEGDYVSSRKIGADLYLVANKFVDAYALQGAKEGADFFAPAYRDPAAAKEFVNIGYDSIRYFPGTVEPNYLMVAALRLNEPQAAMDVSAYLGAGQNIYASPGNLYVASSKFEPGRAVTGGETTAGGVAPVETYRPPLINTRVYKFGFENGRTVYRGQGEVPGAILNQYSMDEYAGYFRLATTKGDPWGAGEETSKNNVYVLGSDLKIVGRLENLAPGEKIYSARFMGERAYMVTFKQVDPLFVIDLRNPTAPAVLGELKIPGYSDYLHPFDENHIIGFGKEALEVAPDPGAGISAPTAFYQGMKIAVFDVSDVAHPVEKFKTTLGDRGTDSEMLHNPKALLFDKDRGLLAFPVTVMEIKGKEGAPKRGPVWPDYGTFSFQGAYVYDIDLAAGLKLKGRISHLGQDGRQPPGEESYDRNVNRVLYIEEVLYTVSPGMIKANYLDDLRQISSIRLP